MKGNNFRKIAFVMFLCFKQTVLPTRFTQVWCNIIVFLKCSFVYPNKIRVVIRREMYAYAIEHANSQYQHPVNVYYNYIRILRPIYLWFQNDCTRYRYMHLMMFNVLTPPRV